MSERSPQKIKKLREQADRLRFFSRSSLYIARTIVLVFCGVMLCLLAFISCARLANLYILVNEGMSLRIECILQDGPREELDNYFTAECIASDGRLQDTTYQPYTVSSYNYVLDFSHIRVWPWLKTMSVDVLEQADRITGSANFGMTDVPGNGYVNLRIKRSDKTVKELLDGRLTVVPIVAAGGGFNDKGEFVTPVQTAMLCDGERFIGRLPEFAIKSNMFDMFGKGFIGVGSDDPVFNDKQILVKMDYSK